MIKSCTRILFFLISLHSFASQAEQSGLPFESFFRSSMKIDADGTEIYETNWDLKKHKKVGIGAAIGGVSGAYGINAELNLDPMSALVIGIGTGPSYGTFNLQGKVNFESYYLSPFLKMGYSRWFNSGRVPSTATSSGILTQIYSSKDLRAGKFDAGFLVASVGAEYNQLEGELSGVNFYGEMTMLLETTSLKMVPAGAVGVTYYY
jgi:hypothetical protein